MLNTRERVRTYLFIYDIDTNSYKYSGIAIFDCTPAIGEAFVKLVKGDA